jgi:hypothetical protein
VIIIRDGDDYLVQLPDGRLTPVIMWALPPDGKGEVTVMALDPDDPKGEGVMAWVTRDPGVAALAEQRLAAARDAQA